MAKASKKQKQSLSTEPTIGIGGYTALGTVNISVYCTTFPANSFGLKFIWMQFPSLCIPQVGDIIDTQEWDDELDDRFYIVKKREFVFIDKNEFDSISLTVEPVFRK